MLDCEVDTNVISNGGSQMFAKYLKNFTSTNQKNLPKNFTRGEI